MISVPEWPWQSLTEVQSKIEASKVSVKNKSSSKVKQDEKLRERSRDFDKLINLSLENKSPC